MGLELFRASGVVADEYDKRRGQSQSHTQSQQSSSNRQRWQRWASRWTKNRELATTARARGWISRDAGGVTQGERTERKGRREGGSDDGGWAEGKQAGRKLESSYRTAQRGSTAHRQLSPAPPSFPSFTLCSASTPAPKSLAGRCLQMDTTAI